MMYDADGLATHVSVNTRNTEIGVNSEKHYPDRLLRLCEACRLYAAWWEVCLQETTIDPDAACAAMVRIAEAFRSLARHEAAHLSQLLKQSDDLLVPLSDPLRIPLTRHRWLDMEREREESYSDWLAWLLEQMGSSDRVLQVFGLDRTELSALVRDEKPSISREEWFFAPTGEPKRLDIVVRFGQAGVLLVEVKIRDLEDAGGSDNLPIYRDWIEKHQTDPKRRCTILLVPIPIESPFPGWEIWSRDSISLNLRFQAREYASTSQNLLLAAMLLCFAGAVEQNILGLHGITNISAPQTAIYLKRFLQGDKR